MDHAEYARLHAPHLLNAWGGEALQKSEVITRMAMNPLWLADDPKRDNHVLGAEHIQITMAVLRTGGIFVFDRDDIPPATPRESAMDELPPLPFPRMWIELSDMDPRECIFYDFDGKLSFWLGFVIIEEVPNERWRILAPLIDRESLKQVVEMAETGTLPDVVAGPAPKAKESAGAFLSRHGEDAVYHFTACREWSIGRQEDGRIGVEIGTDLLVFDQLVRDGKVSQKWADLTRGLTEFPETLVQLLHTLGVSHERMDAPRTRRREFRRRYGVDHPNIYWVRIRSTPNSDEGRGDREYHHRWLVRGHFRKQSAGAHFIRGKGACTWVRPYVKGPEGAPWKGRPIYTTKVAEAHA